VPAIVARPIRIYLWSLFVTRNGPLNQLLFFLDPIGVFLYNEFAMYVGLLGDLLPIGITLIWISLRRIDESLLSASYDLGASPAQTFRRVTLPMSAPGIAAASIIMSVLSVGVVTIPQMLGGPSVRSVGQLLLTLFRNFQFPLAGAISITLLCLVGALFLVVQRVTDLTTLFEEIEG
jgi:spermidine/putrescine transport system permease protein